MDFGMFAEFPVRPGMSQAAAFEESFRLVDTAGKAGLDSVWLAEHHFRSEESVLASPLLVASAIAQRLVYGTPESVVERLRRYRDDLGLSGVVLEMKYGGQIPHAQVVNSIRLTMEQVAPEFK